MPLCTYYEYLLLPLLHFSSLSLFLPYLSLPPPLSLPLSPFLFVGKRVHLKGYQGFLGGLDSEKDMTGEFSVSTDFAGLEVMFHVAPLMPYDPNDPQQVRLTLLCPQSLGVVTYSLMLAPDMCVEIWTYCHGVRVVLVMWYFASHTTLTPPPCLLCCNMHIKGLGVYWVPLVSLHINADTTIKYHMPANSQLREASSIVLCSELVIFA